MKFTIVGCGDAFGSGGRLQTAYVLDAAGERLLVDCGATTLIGFARLGIDPLSIDHVVISHLHGDHFAGLIWLVMHGMYVRKRTKSLVVYGPPGIGQRFVAASEALFSRSTMVKRPFELSFVEMQARRPVHFGVFDATAFEVVHPSGAPSHALRIAVGGKVWAFSGDTEWTDELLAAGQGADVFVAECYRFDGAPVFHLSYRVMEKYFDRIGAKRYVMTHMAEDMLARRGEVVDARVILAEDGLVLAV
ncbi:MAG: MBL fold metallo-hydrolase [Hyphomicrobiaceae bacterium]|nr:MBL fold metallo-hydrolase [Hyphomicrobiaceae bacterium]